MGLKIFLYAISLLASTFAVSGINFDGIIKRNHVWEARFLSVILILVLTYLLTNLMYDLININIM